MSEEEVRSRLSYPEAIRLVREAYKDIARGRAENPQRIILQAPNGASMFFMPGYIHGQKYVTMKAARLNPENMKRSLPTVLSMVYAYDARTGEQVAEIEADSLTMVRTAASTAVATDYLARNDVKALGLFGAGREASAHIPALLEVRNFQRVLVYSRSESRRNVFADEMTEKHGITTEAVGSPDEVARESDVIITATTSWTPVLDGAMVRSGSMVNSIGNAVAEGREVDSELVRRSIVVVDSRSQALTTYGDIIKPIKEKAIRESEIIELGDLLIGKSKLPDQNKVRLFKSGGLAPLDAIVTNHILDSIGNREDAKT